MPQDLVSVIIPMYNAAEFLAPTVRSVAAQTHRDLEILLVDDGSTDRTTAVAREFCAAEPRARYLHKPNGGQGSARNLGIRESSGAFIAFCDSDDRWDPEKLERQLQAFADPEVGLVYCGSKVLRNGELSDASGGNPYYEGRCFWELLVHNCVACSGAVLRRAVTETSGLFDERRAMMGVEDKHLWLRVARMASLKAVREPLITLTIRGESVSRQEVKMLDAELFCLDDIKALFPPDGPQEDLLLRQAYETTFRHYAYNLFHGEDYARARDTFVKLAAYSLKPRDLMYLLVSCLPPGLIKLLRRR